MLVSLIATIIYAAELGAWETHYSDISDDGGLYSSLYIGIITAPISFGCAFGLWVVPLIPVSKRKGVPFHRRGEDSGDVDGAVKPRLHPAVDLTIHLLAAGVVTLMVVFMTLFAYGGIWDYGVLVVGWLCLVAAGLGHWWGMVKGCVDVHRLRREQVGKRESLRAGVAARDLGREGQRGLEGWVELEEGGGRGRGAGGGLGGVGRAL